MKLNTQQEAAAKAPAEGVIRVTATAGSGKTTLLLARLEHLFAEAPGNMQLLAFNKSIADELTERVEKKINPFASASTTVETSHGFAYRLVRRHYRSLGFSKAPDKAPDWQVFKEAATIAEKLGMKIQQGPMAAVMAAYDFLKGNGQKNALPRYATQNKVFKSLFKLYGEEKLLKLMDLAEKNRDEQGLLTFTDMLRLACSFPEHIYEDLDITHLLVDEAQDLNIMQHELINRISPYTRSITMVGDRAQAIYGFSGARPDVFDDIPRRYNAKDYVLETNYRSKKPILDVANKLLGLLNSNLELRPNGEQPGISPVFHSDPGYMLPWLRVLEENGVAPEDIAIIFRANAHTLDLQIMLTEAGIPYRCTAGSFFDHSVFKDTMAYYKVVFGAGDEVEDTWRRIAKHVPYMPKALIEEALERVPNEPWMYEPERFARSPNERAWRVMQGRIREVKRVIQTYDSTYAIRYLVDEILMDIWISKGAGDLELTKQSQLMVEAVKKLAEKYEKNYDIHQFYMNRPEPSTTGINITSAHKAKGLEWKVAALWGLGMGSFPLRFSDQERSDDELRLLYVAVTRAKEELVGFCSTTSDPSGGLLAALIPDPLKNLRL